MAWLYIYARILYTSNVLERKVLLTVIDLLVPEVFMLKRGSWDIIISCLRSLFASFGFCKFLKSDNGSVFVSKEFNFLLWS